MNTKASSDATATVLAVAVAHNPGDWFEETLESLARQDYEHLSVAVVDISDVDIEARVRAVIPDATIIKMPDTSGFSAAANSVLSPNFASLLLTPSFLLICHDDVALASDAVTILVTQATNSRASVAGPKLVHWDHPEVIQHVGFNVDRFGVGSDVAGINELDQEQHDTVHDVFAVGSAVMLIETDLFVHLGGFDPAMSFRGENIDLCWRAQMAGASIVTVGNAKVRHREQFNARARIASTRREDSRHSLRTMLVNHGRISLLIFVPLAIALSAGEVLLAVITGRFGRARITIDAWMWNITRIDEIISRRRANARIRKVRQADVTAMQYLGSTRLTSFLQHRFGSVDIEGPGGFFSHASRSFLGSLSIGKSRMSWICWALVIVVVLFGSRVLIAGGVPAVGDFAPFPSSAAAMLDTWWGGWSERETGAPSSNLGGLLWLGALGWFLELVGSGMELMRTLWVIAPIFIGLVGAYRMMIDVNSTRAKAGALVGYLLVLLPTASVASGSISGLIGYAAAPWMLVSALRSLGATPFGSREDCEGGRARLLGAASWLGVIAGLSALFVPAAVGLLVIVTVGLAAGSLLVGRPGGIPRLFAITGLALLVAAFVILPLTIDLLVVWPTWDIIADGRGGSAGSVSLVDLVLFSVSPGGHNLSRWMLLVPMVLPLLLGRNWRLEQSVRLWMVAMTSWALAFVSQLGVLGVGLPDVHLLLAPAAAAAAALFGLAVVTVEHDLRFSHFGWRHAMVPVAVIAVTLQSVGFVTLLEDGRWGLARNDHHTSLRFEPEVLSGGYRVLWIGASEFLPLEGRHLDANMTWAATSGSDVTIVDRSVTADPGKADLLESAIKDIADGQTTRGGRRLAGLGVRYVVLIHRLAPAPFSTPEEARPVPTYLVEALRSQLDLQQVEGVNSALTLFVNTSWVSMRSLYPQDFDEGVSEIADLDGNPLIEGAAVFSGNGPPWSGSAPENVEVFVAQAPSPGWELSIDGVAAPHREVLSWARAYHTSTGGDMVLHYSSPWWRRASQIIGVIIPLVLLAAWLRPRIGRT